MKPAVREEQHALVGRVKAVVEQVLGTGAAKNFTGGKRFGLRYHAVVAESRKVLEKKTVSVGLMTFGRLGCVTHMHSPSKGAL